MKHALVLMILASSAVHSFAVEAGWPDSPQAAAAAPKEGGEDPKGGGDNPKGGNKKESLPTKAEAEQ